MLSVLKEKKIPFNSQEKDKIEADLPNLRPLKRSTGNKNWHGKEHFLAIYSFEKNLLDKRKGESPKGVFISIH